MSAPTASPGALATVASTPTIAPTWSVPQEALVSPDGERYAVVRQGGRLIAGADDGSEQQLASAVEITNLQWFPDSRHLVYVDHVESETEMQGLRSRVWIADLTEAQTHAVAPGFAPLLSPEGRYLAFLHGERLGDACLVAYGLGIVELNDQFVPVALVRQDQISGIPAATGAESFYPDLQSEAVFPGQWQAAGSLEVAMRWACEDQAGENGLYLVDAEARAAQRQDG